MNIDFLNNGIYSSHWKSKITIKRLEQAIIQTQPFWKFLGYNRVDTCARAFRKIFPNSPDKTPREHWDNYIRRKCEVFQCGHCKSIFSIKHINYPQKDSSHKLCDNCIGWDAVENKERNDIRAKIYKLKTK